MPNQPASYTFCYSPENKVIAHIHSGAQQSGAVLIIGLIMLLLLTLIGVTGSQVTGLEEKIAGNSRNQSQAFQAAESALLAGEAVLASTNPPKLGDTGFYPTIGSARLDIKSIDWTDTRRVVAYNSSTEGIYQPPAAYLIDEFTSTENGDGGGDSLEVGLPPEPVTKLWYRVTARGTGGSAADAVVMLQSIYAR